MNTPPTRTGLRIRKLWDLTPAEAETFLAEYVAASPARIAWFENLMGRTFDTSVAGLVDVWVATIDWWDAGGNDTMQTELPMWCEGDPTEWLAERLSAASMLVADALGYLIARALLTEEPRLRWHRYDEQDIALNQPQLDAGNHVSTGIIGLGHGAMLNLEENRPPRSRYRAARDPEYLSDNTAHFLNRARTEGALGART